MTRSAPAGARGWRLRAAAALSAGFLALITLTAGTQPATAAAADSGCTASRGVTVVVDLRQLGGGILQRCAPGLTGSATGIAALSAAGIPYQGTSQWGSAFMCRLLGRPSATEALALPGNSNYHELCITTPPATAYWAYWWAPNGGPWRYSDSGVTAHRITPGGFEGWVFTLRSGAGTGPPPGVDPVLTFPVPVKATPTPVQTAAPQVATGIPAGGAVVNSTGPPSTGAPESAVASTANGAASVGTPLPSTVTGPTTGPSTGPSTSTDIAQVGGDVHQAKSGPSAGLIVGICLLAFFVTVGAGTAWRRAHSGGEQ